MSTLHEQWEQTEQVNTTNREYSKTEANINSQDVLTGELIGLAHACDGTAPTESTYQTLIDGLLATAANTNSDNAAIMQLIDQTRSEKRKLTPQCQNCVCPCGRNDAYPMQKLWNDETDIRSLKLLLLSGLREMAAHAYRAWMLGIQNAEVNYFLVKGLFNIGEELTAEELLPLTTELNTMKILCMSLLNAPLETP